MMNDKFLYALRRDLKSQAEGLAIQRAAILSQIAEIEKVLGIKKGIENGTITAKSLVVTGSELNQKSG